MKSSLCSLFITLSFLFISPSQNVPALVPEGRSIPQEAKTPTQEQKPTINLQDYAGRYQADPNMVENFILVVFLEKDQLWIKPALPEKYL